MRQFPRSSRMALDQHMKSFAFYIAETCNYLYFSIKLFIYLGYLPTG